jgi:hypothetical protein
MARYGFDQMKVLPFTVFMDRERSKRIPARAYLAKKSRGIEPDVS